MTPSGPRPRGAGDASDRWAAAHFAAAPVAEAPADVKARVAAALARAGVPMAGSRSYGAPDEAPKDR